MKVSQRSREADEFQGQELACLLTSATVTLDWELSVQARTGRMLIDGKA